MPSAGEQSKDFVAALFQAAGQFIYEAIIEADPLDLLELDIVVIRYTESNYTRALIEVKGGKWGSTDLFKVVGWMHYLGISEGAFFVTDWYDLEGAEPRFEPLGLKLFGYRDLKGAATQFSADRFGNFVEPRAIELWRYSYNLERKIVRQLNSSARVWDAGRSLKKITGL
jgi:hypothetical protein